jgi:hypothetical protein
MLVEPIDIANWYLKEKNLNSGHYIDGITDELVDDNGKRPGRYILLQQLEFATFGGVESSLDTARTLKTILGTTSWKLATAQLSDDTS